MDESEGSQDGSQETDRLQSSVQSIKGESSVGPRWTKLALRGEAPVARAGHALVALDRFIVVFGGGGGKGWMSKQQEYRNDVHVIDRETMRWRRLAGIAPSEAGRGGLAPTQVRATTVALSPPVLTVSPPYDTQIPKYHPNTDPLTTVNHPHERSRARGRFTPRAPSANALWSLAVSPVPRR